MNITLIGVGKVGAPLAVRLSEAGHEVTLLAKSGESASLERALKRNARFKALPMQDAVKQAEVVFLAIPFLALEATLRPVAQLFEGKIVVDCTNPVGPGLTHGLSSKQSGSEWISSLLPKAKVVKAFSVYGYENFENPVFPGYNIKPSMLYCGDDVQAKNTVAKLIADVGFEPFDVGGLPQALHLEHMTLLWVRRVRVEGKSPHWVWAALQR